MIKVKNLKKIYPGKVPIEALKDVSFEIEKGKFIAIMGRSGSGKSTLLHQIGLIDEPTEGKISIDNVDMLNLTENEKANFRLNSLGYIFQEYALITELTALENVYLPSQASCPPRFARRYRRVGNDHNAYKKRAEKVLEIVGLGNRLSHYPSELSGGEQQRVAIARALINQPKVLIADEPCANLDSISAKMILELFQKLNKELNQTIVIVTHELEDKQYVNRVIWLKDGLIEKIENRI